MRNVVAAAMERGEIPTRDPELATAMVAGAVLQAATFKIYGRLKGPDAEHAMTSPSRLLRQRRFLPLFATQFLGAFNDNLFKNALVMLVAYRLAAAGAPFLVTLAAGLFILPFFLFSATAGQLADKRDKAGLIRWVKLAEIPLMGIGAWGLVSGSVPLLLGALFLAGVQATFFGPLK